MLENGNFERDTSGWTCSDGVSSDSGTCFNMSKSLYMSGALSSDRYAYQSPAVRTARSTRETFTLSGWAKGYGLPNHDRADVITPTFRLRAMIKYYDTTYGEYGTEEFTADFSPCTEEWQFASVQFSKSKYRTIQFIRVYCEYDYNSGDVYFDDIQLVRNNLETNLSAADFVVESTGTSDDVIIEDDTATPTFDEAKDDFGNVLTETTFADGDFGTIYRAFKFNGDVDGAERDDAGNNLIEETDARGHKTTYTVDGDTSRNEEVTDRMGNKTAYEYDDSGRTTKVTSKDAEGTELANVAYTYDTFDNMTEIVRGDGLKYALSYNDFHNLESIGIDGKSEALIKYTYKNGNGRLKQMTYANGHTMKAIYNSIGQMVAEKWFETEAHAADSTAAPVAHYKYVYDGEGNIVRSVDILVNKEYNYEYEEGRLIRATECDIELSGEIVTSKVIVNTVKYYYDAEGKMTKKVITPASGSVQTIYYETNDDNTVVKFSAGGRTVTSHSKTDSFGRKVFDELQLGTDFVSRQFVYHAGKVSAEHKDNAKVKSSATTQLVSQIILSDSRAISYDYDNEERIIKVDDTIDGVVEYTYDALGQLKTETKDGETTKFEYDNYGNIIAKGVVDENGEIIESTKISYVYGNGTWKDLLTSYNGQTIEYDAQGNPINYLGHTLMWEKGRQLKKFVKSDGTVIDYTYNANGIRTSKKVNGALHTYTLDGTKILREIWDGNALIPLYDNEDGVCGILYNDVPYYFIKNLQGDVIAIVDKDAQTVARYSYDAWGVPEIKLDSSDCQIATINPFRYRGYYYDEDIGLYYLQSRYYDARVGRFIKSDIPEMMLLQLEKTAGTNLFAYCNNDSVGGSDPMGILDAAGVAGWLSASSVFAMFAESLYTAFTATMTKIGLYITGILTPKAVAAFWWQPWVVVGIVVAAVAIVLAAVSVAKSKAQSRADENVRKKVSNTKHTFYEAYFSSGIVTVGAGITQAKAVARLKSGQHVFTMFGYNAKMICSLAGSAAPMWHAKEQNAPNYYNHYHVSKHINSAHCWYLI
jgi:RHS repeat-associated protein